MAEKYYLEFNSNDGRACRLSLQDSQWSYAATRLQGVGRSPVVREHQTDGEDVLGVFRACRLSCLLVDEGGNGLEEFSTGDAYRWKAVLTVAGDTVFEGYYVPDDMNQQVIFAPNTMTLTFSDGLGLLSNFTVSDTDLNLLTDKYTLLEILNACLKKTGLLLGIRTFANIYAQGLMTQRYDDAAADPFFQAEMKLKTYLIGDTGDEWKKCSEVIESILRDFNATIFQEDGYWNIVRVPELQAGSPEGTSYTSNLYTPTGISDIFADASDAVAVNRSQLKALLRPAGKIINTYKYDVIRLLRNGDLSELGAFIGTTVDGDVTYWDYQLVGWDKVGGNDAVIRVVKDTITEFELERYIKFTYAANNTNGIYSNEMFVNQGDRFDFSYSIKAYTDSNFNGRFGVGIYLQNDAGTVTYRLEKDFIGNNTDSQLVWKIVSNSLYTSPSTSIAISPAGSIDISETQTFTLTARDNLNNLVPRFPVDGKLRIFIAGWNSNFARTANRDSLAFDFRLKYELWINDRLTVTGEQHIASQAVDLNNTFEREIKTGDSPKGNVAGTLFVGNTRTETWTAEAYRFGQLSILDEMLLRGVGRYSLEGEFTGALTMYSILAPAFFPGRRFFFNRLVIDYGTGISSIFANEVSGPDDKDRSDFDYTFNYQYR